MAKVQIKPETIATFGGIFHVMDVFERLGMVKLIDSILGKNSNKNEQQSSVPLKKRVQPCTKVYDIRPCTRI